MPRARKGADPADAEEDLLLDARLALPAVEGCRDEAEVGRIGFDVGVQEVQRVLPDLHFPDPGGGGLLPHLHRDREGGAGGSRHSVTGMLYQSFSG